MPEPFSTCLTFALTAMMRPIHFLDAETLHRSPHLNDSQLFPLPGHTGVLKCGHHCPSFPCVVTFSAQSGLSHAQFTSGKEEALLGPPPHLLILLEPRSITTGVGGGGVLLIKSIIRQTWKSAGTTLLILLSLEYFPQIFKSSSAIYQVKKKAKLPV